MLQTLKMLMFNTYTHTPKLPYNGIHDPELKEAHAARPILYMSPHWIPIWHLSGKVYAIKTECYKGKHHPCPGLNHGQLPTNIW